MLSKSVYKLGFMAMLSLALVISSCKKDDDSGNVENTGYAEDMALLQQSFDDMDVLIMKAFYRGAAGLKGGDHPLAVCATIINDTAATPKKMIIDFGNTGCISFDGRFRRGKLVVTYGGDYRTAGYWHKVEPSFYTVDGHKISGSKTLTAHGLNPKGQIYYKVDIEGQIDLKEGGGVLKGRSNRTRTWIAGSNTPQIIDDVFTLEGLGELTRPNGEVFTTQIVDPLHVSYGCNWISKGVIRIIPRTAKHRQVDYGMGECDNKAILTINEESREMTLQ